MYHISVIIWYIRQKWKKNGRSFFLIHCLLWPILLSLLLDRRSDSFPSYQAKLAQQGIPVPEEVWQHLSPLQWAHIHLNGSYHFTDVELEGDFRPLCEYHGSRARLAPRLESVERDAGLLQEEEDVLPLQLSLLGEDEKDL